MDEQEVQLKRRKRTEAYLGMWGVQAEIPLDVLPAPTEASARIAEVDAIRGRALAACALALRGQGLSQIELFGFCDSFMIWDYLTPTEHDFVLTEEPDGTAMMQAAWSYERLWVLLWALGLVRHLAFSDTEIESADAIEKCIAGVANAERSSVVLRPAKELYDAADIAFASLLVARAAKTSMSMSIVAERAAAFDELLPGFRSSVQPQGAV